MVDTNELNHVSHSQLNLWNKCPRQWEYAYVRGLHRPSSAPLLIGSAYHETLEENFRKKMILGHDLDFDICYDFFSTVWDVNLRKAWLVNWGKTNAGAAKDVGLSLVATYLEDVAPLVVPKQVEQTLNSNVGGVNFVLRLDLIDSNNVIVDHKTASSLRFYSQDDVDKDMQASATAFALNKPIVFHFHVAVKSKVPYIHVAKTYRTQADIDWWYNKAVAIIEHMKSGYAPPREDGWWCSPDYCGFHDICRKDLARSIF